MTMLQRVAALAPFSVGVAGRRRDLVLRAFDLCGGVPLSQSLLETRFGPIRLNPRHAPERLLSYCFENVLRHYRRSDLGRYIAAHAGPGAFIDVGANLGMYALVARESGFDTVVVEPEPAHSAFLRRNAHAFGRVIPAAFSDAPGELPLYYEQDNPGATSLFAAPGFRRGEHCVPVTTFSAAAAAGELGDPADIRLVKIDVEGFEAEAVAGMDGFFRAGLRPDIWCEVRGDRSGRNGGSYRRVRALLTPFGYRARLIEKGREAEIREDDLASRAVFDLLFTPER